MQQVYIIMRAGPDTGWRLAHGEFFRSREDAWAFLSANYWSLEGSQQDMYTVERLDLHQGRNGGR